MVRIVFIYLLDDCLDKKKSYDSEMGLVVTNMDEYNQYKEELKLITFEKIKLSNKYSNDKLIEYISNDIALLSNERQKLMTEGFSRVINFNDFLIKYKDISFKIHNLILTKEKLYLIKNNE